MKQSLTKSIFWWFSWFGLIAVFSHAGCKSSEAGALPSRIPEDFRLHVTRSGCFGNCKSYELWIGPQGEARLRALGGMPFQGLYRKTLSRRKVRQLMGAAQEADFYTLEERYDNQQLSDLPTTRIELRMDGRKKAVVNRYGAPERLDELLDAIESLVDFETGFQPLGTQG